MAKQVYLVGYGPPEFLDLGIRTPVYQRVLGGFWNLKGTIAVYLPNSESSDQITYS
jgi:hypothetical protein